jgi:ABC-type transport system involved in multi-copper enzyme maturation permease subunit
MKEFWALVGNYRLKKIRKSGSFRSTLWWKIYAGVFCVALGGLCYGIYNGTIAPVPFGPRSTIDTVLVIFALIDAMACINREWSGQTVSWWLTLPYPRAELLAAKLAGVYIRFLKVVTLSIAALVIIAAAAGMLINPGLWTAQAIWIMATTEARDYILIIAASPLVINYGMFLAVTRQSLIVEIQHHARYNLFRIRAAFLG